jgi:diphthamide synthase subunit DPH2
MPSFRKKLLEKLKNKYDEVYLMTMVEEIANAIINEFFDVIISKSQDTDVMKIFNKTILKPTELAKEVTWDLLQLLFAPIIAVKYAGLFFDWANNSKKSTPLLLLLKLKQFK